MDANDPRHGTSAGYDAHRYDGEEACQSCRDGAAAYEYRRRIDSILGRRYTVPSLGTARRIQALVALGWTFTQISERLGRAHDYARKLAFQSDTYVRSTTADRVGEVYEAMSMTLPPSATGSDKHRIGYAKKTASRYGWAPPLAWDDIDDPNEQPQGLATKKQHATCDPVVVQRILGGEWRLPANVHERRQVIAQWAGDLNELERLTGWNVWRLRPKKEVA